MSWLATLLDPRARTAGACILALFALGAVPGAVAQSWVLSGPVPASQTADRRAAAPITAFVADCDPAGDACAAGPGGVWMISSQGAWHRTVTEPVTSLMATDGVIYAGMGTLVDGAALAGGGILVSADAGVTWSAIGSTVFTGLVVTRVGVDPGAPEHLLASTVAIPDAVASPQPGLYASSDGGKTWQLLAPGPAWDFVWDAGNYTVVAAVGDTLLRSSDNGASFVPVASGALPAGWLRAALALRSDGGVLALFAEPAGAAALVLSSDLGLSWTALSPPPGLFAGADAVAMAADPANADTFWLGGHDAWSTQSDGTEWSDLTPSGMAANQRLIADSSDGNLWLGNDGGLWRRAMAQPDLTLSFTAATPASGAAGSTIPLAVAVTQAGQAMSDVTVQWAASAGSAPSPSVTDGNGIATANFTLPTTAASIYVYATAGDTTITQALAVTPLTPARLAIVSGANQQQPVGTRLPPFTVAVDDQYGNGVANQAVAFSDNGAGGSFMPASATTSSAGQASSQYTLPPLPGAVTLTATSGTLTTGWSETAVAAPDFELVLTAPAAVAAPNQSVTLSLQVIGVGGYNSSVSLVCVQPATGCVVNPATIAAGGNGTVTVSTGAADNNATGLQVVVLGSDATYGLQQEAIATVALSAFSIAAESSTFALAPGGAATSQVTLTAVNGFTGTVNFSATLSDGSPLPPALAASFSPAAVLVSGGATAASTMLSLDAASQAAVPGRFGTTRPATPGMLEAMLAWLAICACGLLWRRRCLVPVAMVLLTMGCGGGASAPATVAATAANVYSVTLIANSGSLQATAPITVTVNP